MVRRTLILSTVVPALVLAGAGCGSNPRPTATVDVSSPTSTTSTTDSVPVADESAAVAALDGSAAFSIRDRHLVRIDPGTNAALASWPLPAGVTSIHAVSPAGRWVALTDRPSGYDASQQRPSTELVVFDARAGAEVRRIALRGDLQPEAFSVDGTLVFALDYRGDHYRVQTITLASGERSDTSNRDKTLQREDMNGTSVRGVLNADHTLLATLYRNPGNADEPAFVHILDLEHAWAYCADLPQPFGTGPPGSDLIELTSADTVIVTATQASRIAEIHIDEVHDPGAKPVTVDYRDRTA
jgi:hypothetical protein